MKLTKRETVLVVILGIILFAAIYFMLLFQPTMNSLQANKATLGELEFQKQQMDLNLSLKEENVKICADTKQKANDSLGKYFSAKKETDIDYMVTTLCVESNLPPRELGFVKLSSQNLGDEVTVIKPVGIAVSVNGKLGDVLALCDKVKASDYMRIATLNFDSVLATNPITFEVFTKSQNVEYKSAEQMEAEAVAKEQAEETE